LELGVMVKLQEPALELDEPLEGQLVEVLGVRVPQELLQLLSERQV
jgi:hypothetical protein